VTSDPEAGQHRDRRRDFPPLPTARGRRTFAESWWGNAWVEALEGPSRSATGRLARGRTYARAGNVGEITVTAGCAAARVQGSQPAPYRTAMNVPEFTAAQWDALLDLVASKAGHIAALLERDMPTALADDAAQAGVRLLPRPHELTPRCSCPDFGNPCKHAAAVFYQVARLLDHDPFVLLLLRGRGERELMAELHRRNTAKAIAATSGPRPGVPARDVFAAARIGLPPLPSPPPEVEHPGPVTPLTSAPAPPPGLDPAALEFLAADTARRAAQLLRQALHPDAIDLQPGAFPDDLNLDHDLVRLAAGGPPTEILHRLSWSSHRTPAALARSARAWQYGGAAALKILDQPWDPDPNYLRGVREEIKRAWDGERAPGVRISGSWLTVIGHDAQLRLGADGLWYPYRKKHGAWWPAGPPHCDVAAVLSDLQAGTQPVPGPASSSRRRNSGRPGGAADRPGRPRAMGPTRPSSASGLRPQITDDPSRAPQRHILICPVCGELDGYRFPLLAERAFEAHTDEVHPSSTGPLEQIRELVELAEVSPSSWVCDLAGQSYHVHQLKADHYEVKLPNRRVTFEAHLPCLDEARIVIGGHAGLVSGALATAARLQLHHVAPGNSIALK